MRNQASPARTRCAGFSARSPCGRYSLRSRSPACAASAAIRPIASPVSFAPQRMQKPCTSRAGSAGRRVEFHERQAESGAPETAERGRWRRACLRHCRARRCLRSPHRIPECAEWRSAPGISSRCRPAARCRSKAAADARVRSRMLGGVDQIAAQFADILEQRAVAGDDVVPELPGGKSVADHHRAAAHQHGAGRDHAADAVIHRQAIIHAVVGPGIHQPGKPEAPLHQPADD